MANDHASGIAAPERSAQAAPGPDGAHSYQWNLTGSERCDPVVLCYQPQYLLPIIFVPGIMGSNLKSKGKGEKNGIKAWRLDTTLGQPLKLLFDKMNEDSGTRQTFLHPDRTEVDDDGAVPRKGVGSIADEQEYKARGWGEVGEGSYHGYLKFLEEKLNGKADASRGLHAEAAELVRRFLEAREADGAAGNSSWRPLRELQAPSDDELTAFAEWRMPVYACGYNWLDDNKNAAERLLQRIRDVIARNNTGRFACRQVLLVTHSMGGLVARACAKLEEAEPLIAGIVHGVMPANGAAVAYRRCKVGMWDESSLASLVIGKTGQHVTSVFAQAPGALELLPTQHYNKGWLEVRGPDGKAVEAALPANNPYEEIYKRRDRWWALVKEEWLAPQDGVPITWETYLRFLRTARVFHENLSPQEYHPNTHAFYGDADKGATRSFERLTWRMVRSHRQPLGGGEAPTPARVYGMSAKDVRLSGSNPEHVGGEHVVITDDYGRRTNEFDTSHWELVAAGQDGSGDGTVPASSGRAPVDCAKVQQVFRVQGIEHEPAYKDDTVQRLTLYSLCTLAAKAQKPAAVKA